MTDRPPNDAEETGLLTALLLRRAKAPDGIYLIDPQRAFEAIHALLSTIPTDTATLAATLDGAAHYEVAPQPRLEPSPWHPGRWQGIPGFREGQEDFANTVSGADDSGPARVLDQRELREHLAHTDINYRTAYLMGVLDAADSHFAPEPPF